MDLFIDSYGTSGGPARARCAPQSLFVRFNRWDQQVGIAGPLRVDLVRGDDLVFCLLDLDHLAKLGGLARFALANNLRGRLKNAEQFFGKVVGALQDPRLRLPDDLLDS